MTVTLSSFLNELIRNPALIVTSLLTLWGLMVIVWTASPNAITVYSIRFF